MLPFTLDSRGHAHRETAVARSPGASPAHCAGHDEAKVVFGQVLSLFAQGK